MFVLCDAYVCNVHAWGAGRRRRVLQLVFNIFMLSMCRFFRFHFKTTFRKNPQLTTTYRQKAPIAQYVRRIDAQIAVRFCAICSIYIMPKALGDILTVSILIGGCVFLFAKLVCAPPSYRGYIYPHCTVAKWQNDGTHQVSLANKKRILRLKYLRSKYRLRALGMI